MLCPGNIATAGREWVGTVTRLGSTYHGELRRLLGRALLVASAASFVLSVVLWFSGSREEGAFVGLWVPSIFAAGAFWTFAAGDGS